MIWTTLSHIARDEHADVFAEVIRCLRTGGCLIIFDNDLAGVSMAVSQYDIFKVWYSLIQAALDIHVLPGGDGPLPPCLGAGHFHHQEPSSSSAEDRTG